ncbi:MAG: UPF0175 family protein [Promethearchaeota archaeon]
MGKNVNSRLEYALKLYQKGEISLGKAAEISSLNIWEFLDKLSEKRIPLNYDIKDLMDDEDSIKKLLNEIK